MYIKTDFLVRELNRNTDFLNKLKDVEDRFVTFYESDEFFNIYDRLLLNIEVKQNDLELFALSLYYFYKTNKLIFEIFEGKLMINYGDISIKLEFDENNFFKPLVIIE